MERLKSLLIAYNNNHLDDLKFAPWSKQYCQLPFPKYWEIVYSILKPLDKNNTIIEIGCGLGDITSILCYLEFKNIYAFEKNNDIYNRAILKIHKLFNLNNTIHNDIFPNGKQYKSDILILVNCAYADMANSKTEYLKLIETYYTAAGYPQYFIMECIDSSYTIPNKEFPEYIRLNKSDIFTLFPNHNIQSWETYTYPINKKSKTLYLIQRL